MRPNPDPRVVRAGAWLSTIGLAVGLLGACGSAHDTNPQSRTFALDGTTLTVESDNAAIALEAGDVDELQVTRWFTGEDDQGTWELDGSTLTLDSSCGWIRNCDVRYAITVPADTSVRLVGENTAVDASGFTQLLDIRVQNGDLTVTDSSADLDLQTQNGSQEVRDSSPTHLRSRTDNGAVDMSLDEPPAELDVTADNGRIAITVPGGTSYAVAVTTDSGHVENGLRTDPESSRRISVQTDNGEVTLREQLG